MEVSAPSEDLCEPGRGVCNQDIHLPPCLPQLVLQYLESKSFFAAEHALRMQLASEAHSQGAAMAGDMAGMQSKNLYTSKLEEMLGLGKESSAQSSITPKPVKDFVLRPALASVAAGAAGVAGGPSTLENNDGFDQPGPSPVKAKASRNNSSAQREMVVTAACTSSEENALREHHGPGGPRTNVIFNDHPSRSSARNRTARISLPVIYDPDRSAHAARAPHLTLKERILALHASLSSSHLLNSLRLPGFTRALPQQRT